MKKMFAIFILIVIIINILPLTHILAEDNAIPQKSIDNLTDFLKSTDENEIANAQKLGIKNIDNLQSEIQTIDGLSFNENKSEIIEIDFSGKNLLGKLDISSFTLLEKLNLENNKIQDLVVGTISSLEDINLKNNSLTYLDFSKCENIKNIDVSNNYLHKLLLNEKKIYNLNIENNLFNFNDVLQLNKNSETISFNNQKNIHVIAHKEINNIFSKKSANFSIYGATKFTWYNEANNVVFPEVKNNNEFTFDDSFLNKTVYCVMENENLKNLIIKTQPILITPQDYSLLIYSLCILFLVVALFIVVKTIVKVAKASDNRLK